MDKSGYGSFEQGNVLSFSQAQAAIQEESDREVNFYTLCQQKILQTIRTSMISVRQSLNERNKVNGNLSFELFGYDFMLDEDLNPWLIEVNTNPSI